MSAQFQKLTIVGTTAFALLAASAAFAAPSLGLVKGRPYYGSSQHTSHSWNARSYAPSYSTSTETRQSFSYEPAEKAAAPEAAKQADVKKSDAQQNDAGQSATAAPRTTRRSYSYEPATESARRMHNRRSAAPHDQWLRSKAEPHRYSR